MGTAAKLIIGLVGLVAVWLTLATTLFAGISPAGAGPGVARTVPPSGSADASASQTLVGSPPGDCAGAYCSRP